MNFLKIGSSPVVEIPLAVKFENMHLNQCYQILPGSKVVTEFDPNWSNIVDVDNIADRLTAVYAEVKDLLVSAPENTAAIQAKIEELNEIKADLASSGFRPEYITEQSLAIDGATSAMSCFAPPVGARLANSCSVEDVVTALDGAESVVLNKPCNPTNRGDIYSWMLKKYDASDYIKNFADGFVAHNIISNYYLSLPENGLAEREYGIPYSSTDEKHYGYADLVNHTNRFIFEIKPQKSSGIGFKEVNRYIEKANKHCPPAGGNWVAGTGLSSVVFPWPLDPSQELRVKMENDKPGVIIYDVVNKTTPQPTPIPLPVEVPDATKQRLSELLKRLIKNTDSAYRDKEIRKFLLDLSEAALVSIIVGGVVIDILGGVEIYASGGTATAPALLQMAIATSFVTIGYEILSN